MIRDSDVAYCAELCVCPRIQSTGTECSPSRGSVCSLHAPTPPPSPSSRSWTVTKKEKKNENIKIIKKWKNLKNGKKRNFFSQNFWKIRTCQKRKEKKTEGNLSPETSCLAGLKHFYVFWKIFESLASQQVSLCQNIDLGWRRYDRKDFKWEFTTQLVIHLRHRFPCAGKCMTRDLRSLFSTPTHDCSVDTELVDGNDCAKQQLRSRHVTGVVNR